MYKGQKLAEAVGREMPRRGGEPPWSVEGDRELSRCRSGQGVLGSRDTVL